ncbi:MAG: DNA polymerase III, alpha subunit (gram-positive type) [Solidesulfovibrio magneticus str. Maddingley MBC34]|uniref:DNA polymerase III, alpha subunit (Gram-positive type) n=1 Tax=Solidesulfovibrio magneticus str. Maddingley MBC34 TaxID=1206767 RepID=K6H8Y2_9BACT|nr:MAG: DNA polymerase III, alpha subunit (gram-positive type) [Solidesulfovibrio magneticus str. Maddingley MBC34]
MNPRLAGFLRCLGRRFARPPVHPALAAHQAAQAGREVAARLGDLEFVVLDTELTGFDPKRDAIVSVAAVRLRGLAIMAGETFAALTRPQRDVPRQSSLVHGLTASALSQADDLEAVLRRLLDFIGPAVIVGHYVDLDMAFLNAASRRLLGGELAAPCIDTLRLAMAYEEKCLSPEGGAGLEHAAFDLPSLCRRYGLPEFAAHDARHDALAAAYLFVYLAKKLGRGRALTLPDLWRAGRHWWM